ncbi:MAG: hypothetical protein QOD16_10710 [Nitrososphaeraceae archaeon]|nr:hypothetical protein [Nitrososphaeraceae archaeon]
MTRRVAYIYIPPTLAKNLKVLIKVLMIYPMLVVKKNLKVNQTGNGVQGGVLVGETASESTNQTDGGVTDKPKGWHEIHPTWKVVNE